MGFRVLTLPFNGTVVAQKTVADWSVATERLRNAEVIESKSEKARSLWGTPLNSAREDCFNSTAFELPTPSTPLLDVTKPFWSRKMNLFSVLIRLPGLTERERERERGVAGGLSLTVGWVLLLFNATVLFFNVHVYAKNLLNLFPFVWIITVKLFCFFRLFLLLFFCHSLLLPLLSVTYRHQLQWK